MRMKLAAAGSALLLVAPAAIAQAQPSDVKAAIEERGKAFEQAYNSGDAAGLADLYTEDAAILPPGAARAEGREAIAEFWGGAMEQGLSNLDLTTVEVEAAGDMAAEIGTLTATAPAAEGSNQSEIAGKYLVVWKRGEDGTWRLHRDIWNLGQ